ncbi:MAG TPA: hypothetical protein VF765_07220 [Polyangiaceae bacterium]
MDDVFIFLRYARNLASSGQYAFDLGTRVEGTSSVAWTGLLALVWRAGWGGLGAAKALSFGAVLAIPAACGAAVRPMAPERPWLVAVPAMALALDADLASWAASGMDTPLWSLACVACVLLADRPRVAVVALGSLAWIRPEGPLLAAAGVLALSPDRRALPRLALLAAAPVVFLTLLRLAYFQDVVPNTFWAKMHAVDGKDFTGLGYLGSALSRRPLLLLVLPLLAAVRMRGSARLRLALALLLATFLFALIAGGDWMPNRRLLVPALPLAAVLASAVVARLARPFAVLAAGALLLEAGLTFDHALDQDWRDREYLDEREGRWRLSSHPFAGPYPLDWMPTHLLEQIAPYVAPGDTVAHGDVGELPYVMGDVSFLDGFGLVDRAAGRLTFRPGDPALRAAARDEFFASNPAVAIVVLDESTGRPFAPAQDAALADARFAAGWRELARVPTWGDHPCVTYVRRDIEPVDLASANARRRTWLASVPDVAPAP